MQQQQLVHRYATPLAMLFGATKLDAATNTFGDNGRLHVSVPDDS